MKRVLIGLLVLSLVLWTVSVAFAAGFSDTKGTKYEDGVETLSTLGLLAGFPDGTFRPGDTITRAQFCAVAVRGLGLENAAEYAAGATIFPDVPATHWAAGYINIAVDQGICKGFPDGTFRPEAPVTYVEALAMLVRVLGYEPAVRGSWPTNYLVKAFELGMSKGVTFSAGAPATRGDVALLVNNCLGIDLMMQTVVGDQVRYEVKEGVTLLDERLGYATLTGVVTETGDVLGTDLDSDEADIDTGDADTTGTYQLAKGLDLTPWLGFEIKAWLDGDTVLLAKKTTSDDSIYTDTIDKVAGDKVTLADLDETYKLDGEAVVYWNFVQKDAGDVDGDWVGADVVVVLDDEEELILALLATQFDGSYVVRDMDVDDEELYVVDEDGAKSKVEVGAADISKFVKDGVEIDLEDVELWDVAHYAKYTVGGDDVLYFEIVDEKVSGKLDEIGLDADDNIVLTVNSKDYTAGDASYSKDGNASYANVTEAALGDFAGEKVTLYLDKYGDVRHIVGDVEEAAAPANVGIVAGDFYTWDVGGGDFQYFLKIFTSEGKKTRYEWDEDTEFTVLEGINTGVGQAAPLDGWIANIGTKDHQDNTLCGELEEGTAVEFSLNSDGLLASLEEYKFEHPDEAIPQTDINDTYNTLKLDDVKYKATGSTVIFDRKLGKEDVMNWDKFEDIEITDGTLNGLRAYRDGDTTVDIVVFDSTDPVTYPGVADTGIVLKRVVTSDGTAFKILVEDESGQYLKGEATVTSLVYDNWSDVGSGSEGTDIDVGDLVSYGLDSAGEEFTEIKEYDASFDYDADGTDGVEADETFPYAWVNEGGIDEDNMILTVRCDADKDKYYDEGTKTNPDYFDIVLTEDTIIYDVTGTPKLASFGDLEEDMKIQFVKDAGGLVSFIKIIDTD